MQGDGARPGRRHSPRPGAHLQRLINKQPRRETSGSGEQAGGTLPNPAASPMRSAPRRGEQLGPAGVPGWGCPGGARMGTRGGASPSIAGAGRAAWEGAEPLGDVGVTGGGIPECCGRPQSHQAASCAGGVARGRGGGAERIGTEQSRLQPLPLNTEAYIRDYDIEPGGQGRPARSRDSRESTAPRRRAAPATSTSGRLVRGHRAGGQGAALRLVLRLGVFVVDVAAHGSGVDALRPEEDPVAGLVAVGLSVVLGVAPGGQRLAAALAA